MKTEKKCARRTGRSLQEKAADCRYDVHRPVRRADHCLRLDFDSGGSSFTLQTFAVCMTAGLFRAQAGTLTIIVYLLMGGGPSCIYGIPRGLEPFSVLQAVISRDLF